MSGRRQDWPRFARAEIRDFAQWLDREGWSYEGEDADGHTLWSHPKATAQYKLPSTPKHFNVRITRAEVLRLIGRRPEGKRKGKPTPKRQRQDFTLTQARRQAQTRPTPAAPKTLTIAVAPAAPVAGRVPRRLPWEGQPDDYDRGIDRLMREVPHR